MNGIEVKGLCKRYPSFTLDHVSFAVQEGRIMGYIGRNGAGKSTTFKAMTGFVHPDEGSIEMLGLDFAANELLCKQSVGIVLGPFQFYPKKKIRDITEVTKRFYRDWDENEYARCLKAFKLDESKTPEQLSTGMKVKYSLALALSHRAKAFILDEPTSGLDPVSRDELLDIFKGIVKDGKRSILFSTQITSDLDKCADGITYIKEGRIIASEPLEEFKEAYRLVEGPLSLLNETIRSAAVGIKQNDASFSALLKKENAQEENGLKISACDLETIMVYTERGTGDEISHL